MIRLFTPSLTMRIVGLIALGLGLTSLALIWRTEAVLEDALLQQIKRQAHVFLLGVEREFQLMAEPLDPDALQQMLDHAAKRNLDALDFSINQLYVYDRQGVVVAHTATGLHPAKNLQGHYGDVLRDNSPYLGREIEYKLGANDRIFPRVDVIIPLHIGDEVIAGVEAEINLKETLQAINELDNRYEGEIIVIILLGTFLVLLFIWWVVHRCLIGPIQTLGGVTHDIADGALSSRVEDFGEGEIGILGESINKMAGSIETLFTEQEQAHLQMLQSLVKALEAKDSYTAGHSGRVTKFAVQLGRRLGLAKDQINLLKQGALMHDLGKIGISETILNKSSPLEDDEYEVMRRHPVLTATIMRPLKRFKEFAEIAAWHHERWDGKGYPDGLKGEEIPLLARIVSIADTWDAMTGTRVYRKGMPMDQALAILIRERDLGQWDPKLLDLFIELIRDEMETRSQVTSGMFGEPTLKPET